MPYSKGRPGPPGIEAFRRRIYDNYAAEGRRDLPWRLTRDPYRILVSEFMLQQTRVSRVLAKYSPFLERFPGFGELASAPLREVLVEWSGLGYNSRAKRLRDTAAAVVSGHGGSLPESPGALGKLPGIGRATAGAVCAFAFGIAVPFIETNIRTVFIHCFFEGREAVRDGEIMPLVEATLDLADPRNWYYALMDYGVMLKSKGIAPNALSAHYGRQGAFEGSTRQARGAILRALAGGPLTEAALGRATALPAERLRRGAASLARDGLIVEEGGRYSIA